MSDWKIVWCHDCMAKVGERIDVKEETSISCPYKIISSDKCKYD